MNSSDLSNPNEQNTLTPVERLATVSINHTETIEFKVEIMRVNLEFLILIRKSLFCCSLRAKIFRRTRQFTLLPKLSIEIKSRRLLRLMFIKQ